VVLLLSGGLLALLGVTGTFFISVIGTSPMLGVLAVAVRHWKAVTADCFAVVDHKIVDEGVGILHIIKAEGTTLELQHISVIGILTKYTDILFIGHPNLLHQSRVRMIHLTMVIIKGERLN
jgi:hypothetical protein